MEITWPGWKNEEMLGEGSFGKVYRITKQEFGTVYEAALKVISIPQTKNDIQAAYAEGMDKESVTQYFKSCMEDIVAEFALMSQMKGNSNIVSYEDHMVVQHDDGIGWDILIRMELLVPLMQHISKSSLSEDDVVRMGIHIARALELCRRRGILHRDIKPENIFLSKDGDFKLGDFGVARVAQKTLSAMSRKGTYTYMAPEVYKGEEYGYAADIYSLGIVLYRFLNDNRTPFLPDYPKPIQFQDREKALNDRITGKPMPMPAHGSEELKRIVMKACAFQPTERYQSAEELEQDLMALQPQGGVNTQTASPKTVPSAPIPQQKISVEEEPEERTASVFGSINQENDSAVRPKEAAGKAGAKWGFAFAGSILFGGILCSVLYLLCANLYYHSGFLHHFSRQWILPIIALGIPAAVTLLILNVIYKAHGGRMAGVDYICEIILTLIGMLLVFGGLNRIHLARWNVYYLDFGYVILSPIIVGIAFVIGMAIESLLLLLWNKTLHKKFVKKISR